MKNLNTLQSNIISPHELGDAVRTVSEQHNEHLVSNMTDEEQIRLDIHNNFQSLVGGELPQKTSAEITSKRTKVGKELGSRLFGMADVETTTYRDSSVGTEYGTFKYEPKKEEKDPTAVNANAGYYSHTTIDTGKKGRPSSVSKRGKTTVSTRQDKRYDRVHDTSGVYDGHTTGSVEVDESRTIRSGSDSSEVYRRVTVHEDGHKTVEQTYYPDGDVDSKDKRTRTWSSNSNDPKEARVAERMASIIQQRVAKRTKGKGTEISEPDKNNTFDGSSTSLTKQEIGILQAKKELHDQKAPQRAAEEAAKAAKEQADYEEWSSKL